MTDPYVSFDTFSVGDSAAESGPTPVRPSLLAKLPRVAPSAPARAKSIQRFDDAESPLHGVHLGEAGADLAMAGPPAGSAPPARRFVPSNPTATIRIDTVSPMLLDDTAPAARSPVAQTAVEPVAVSQPSDETVLDDPSAAWLLNLEAAITPYSRLIVLAAVIAAMGLTIVLLRGGPTPPPSTHPSPSLAPQVSAGGESGSFVASEAFSEPLTASPSLWPAPTTPKPAGELLPIGPPTAAAPAAVTPVGSSPVGSSPVASAAGPASAWRGPAGAKLTGQVLPTDDSRVDVAEAPTYPTTATR